MSPTAKVGAFMLVALIILGIFIVKIEEIPLSSQGKRQRVQAAFPSVAGLDAKSPVRIAGVRVGIVEKIELEGNRALVTLALDPGVVLYRGATAEVTSLGMLGDKYVELYPGELGGPPLAPGTVLVGSSPISFDQVLGTANAIGGDVKEVTAALRKNLGGEEGERRIDEILEHVRQMAAETRALVAANRANVDATIANFRDFSETLKTELPKLAAKLNDLAGRVEAVVDENREDLNASLANLRDLSGRLRTSADNLNEITSKIARGEGTIGKLVNEDETAVNLNAALKSVESGVQSLKDTLGRAQRWELAVNLRSEALPGLDEDGNTTRSALGLDLRTTPNRFFRLELVDSPFGRRDVTTSTTVVVHPDGRRETTVEEITRVTDSATVNAQVGWDFRNASLRAGLFESTGGVGVDTHFLDRRLKLTLEAYDFSRETNPPHLRFEGRYFFTRNIFAYAGWDDPTWKQRSSAILGGGVTWGDEDLKYLLGTAASFGR